MSQQQNAPGADLALPSDRPQPPTLAQQVQKMEQQFALAAPRGIEASQIVRDALTAIRNTPKLLECEQTSVLGGLMTMAQLGLRVGVLGHGWLIPFWNRRNRQHEAQLVIGYQGMIALAYRSQLVDKITARVVHERDLFELEYGLNERLVHRPATGDRGPAVGYYATVKIRGAGEPMFYHMTHEEMCAYRDRYAMAKTREGKVFGPWADNFPDMALKTCIRQLSKFMPKGTDLAVAMAVDDTVRVDLSPTADITHVSHHLERDSAPETARLDEGDLVDDVPVEDPPAGA